MFLVLIVSIFSAFGVSEQTTDSKAHLPSVTEFKKEEESLLQRHQPFYFAYGEPSSKIQLSFKAPLIKDQPIYFAYTQQMFWNLKENSKPFQDSTYNPEFIYRWTLNKSWLTSIDFAPWSHLSNGKKETDSRSVNKRYLRFNWESAGAERWIFRGGAQLAYLYDYEDTNINIRDYIGPLSISFSAIQLFDGWVDRSEFTFLMTPGGQYADKWENGGYQVSWSFRLGGLEIMPAFYVQYYRGYAETLLNYDKHVDEFRVGFIL